MPRRRPRPRGEASSSSLRLHTAPPHRSTTVARPQQLAQLPPSPLFILFYPVLFLLQRDTERKSLLCGTLFCGKVAIFRDEELSFFIGENARKVWRNCLLRTDTENCSLVLPLGLKDAFYFTNARGGGNREKGGIATPVGKWI